MTIGKCDRCWAPGCEETEVYTSVIDTGGGSMHTQHLCAPCGGVESALGDIAGQLAILGVVNPSRAVRPDTIELPATFFGPDGNLLPPPWTYGSTRIGVLAENAHKRMTIVVPVSCMQSMSFQEISQIIRLTEVLRGLFVKVAPAGWDVLA